jgi:Domain of unknown function (DUF5615)
MSIALYFDEHVNAAITAGLRSRGVDVLTVQEDGMRSTDDRLILDRALAIGRVLFRQDRDFLIEAANRQHTGEAFAGIVFAKQEGVAIGKLIDDLELVAKAHDDNDLTNQITYIPF